MHLWDRLLPQAVITLNMLRTSRINPKLSSATHIFGQYDFNRAPMAPPGTRIIAHETPSSRQTWAPHGQYGWYIGPALERSRCYTVYITKTRGDGIVETDEFSPKKSPYHFLQLKIWPLNPQRPGPFCKVGDEQTIDLKRLANISEGAKRQKSKIIVTPTNGVENATPTRVQTTVSPPRVDNTTTQHMSPEPSTSSHSTPNSHRRQKTKSQTCSHTTNTACHVATQWWTA
jgi:hypothetical protein